MRTGRYAPHFVRLDEEHLVPPDGSPSSNARYFDAAASTDEHDDAAVQARSIPRVPAAAPSAARQACCRVPRRSRAA